MIARPQGKDCRQKSELIIQNEAIAGRYNIISDITGRTCAKVARAAAAFHSYGYRVYLVLVHLPAWRAAGRAWQRFEENPFRKIVTIPPSRFVDPGYVYRDIAELPLKTYERIKRLGIIEGYARLDTDIPPGSPPGIHEEKGWQ
jgi:hypothetical protein